MDIAIIGTGNVGGALAKRFAAKGHRIHLGTRDVQDAEVNALAKALGGGASVQLPADAAKASEVVVLAIPFGAIEAVVKGLGPLDGKIVVDCTNPIRPAGGILGHGSETSAAELVQSLAPKARVAKAFNTVGFNIMESPALEGRRATMLFCADDAAARKVVHGLVEDVGFEAIDAGPLVSARLLEHFALVWINGAMRWGLGRDWAFTIARR